MRKPVLRGTTAIIAGALLSLGVASAAEHNSAKVDHPEKQFFMEAAQDGIAEVALGRLAAKQAASEDVKKFGQRMVDDHSKANDELKHLAQSEGITLPVDMDEKAKATQQRLAKLSGTDFDRAYMEEMVKGHMKDVTAFEQESEQAKDPDVKQWATKILPTLKEHLDLAHKTAEKVGVKLSAAETSSEKAINKSTRGSNDAALSAPSGLSVR
jgi:putative membrane protein